jgi:hypothetical protein
MKVSNKMKEFSIEKGFLKNRISFYGFLPGSLHRKKAF